VGRVRAIGPDATRLAEGDWVLCDPTIRSRDGGLLAADLRAGEAVLADLVRRFGPRVRPVRAAAMTVREFGRVVLMGGVGMLGGDDLALPYPWIMRNGITVRGQWMCPPQANVRFIDLVRAGLLDLAQFDVTEFDLEHANRAVDHAAGDQGRFHLTVIRP
jgi:threonine dehydrogenase-like Zn-dependent dehydrogenase